MKSHPLRCCREFEGLNGIGPSIDTDYRPDEATDNSLVMN
jgi:hypothetical protein